MNFLCILETKCNFIVNDVFIENDQKKIVDLLLFREFNDKQETGRKKRQGLNILVFSRMNYEFTVCFMNSL